MLNTIIWQCLSVQTGHSEGLTLLVSKRGDNIEKVVFLGERMGETGN